MFGELALGVAAPVGPGGWAIGVGAKTSANSPRPTLAPGVDPGARSESNPEVCQGPGVRGGVQEGAPEGLGGRVSGSERQSHADQKGHILA